MKKYAAFVLLIVLFSFSAFAIDFNADLTAKKNRITIDDIAEFTLTVYNEEPTAQEFRVKLPISDYLKWNLFTKPMLNPILIEVGPMSNKSIDLFVKPIKDKVAATGSTFVNIDIISESTNEKIPKQQAIGISKSDVDINTYIPTVIIKTDFKDKINPSEAVDFKITLSNQNNLNITGAKLIVSSKLINEEVNLNISPKEEKIVQISKNIDPKTKAQKDTLYIRLEYKGSKVDEVISNFEIIPYSEIIDETDVNKGLLMKSEKIIFTNKGNVKFKGQLTVDTTSMKKFFGNTEPKTRAVKENGILMYVWDVELEPYQSYTVKVSENYLGIVILLILVIGLVVFFSLKRSPIVLLKKVTETDVSEGSLSKIKVLINVKNRSGKKLNEVSIVDKVPKLLEIDKHTTLGSLTPSKIKKNNKHETLILWDIDELNPGEERVINYYLKSDLKILGGLTLQSAAAKFRLNEKEVKTRSNPVFVKV